MTQDEKWQLQYEQMMAFMKDNHRRPSKHRLEEHDMLNWFKATKKCIAKGELPADRLVKFNALLEVADEYRRKNQYQ
jgi:hypothetical protein